MLNAANIAEALNYAASASVVVVDTEIAGGAVDFCRRLRADAVTSQVPLVLRFSPHQQVPQALSDAAVSSDDYDGLVRAIRQLAPEVTDGPDGPLSDEALEAYEEDDDDELFDDGPMTVVWRRPGQEQDQAQGAAPFAAAEWPPLPPQYREGQEHVDYALTFSGYLNALIEALEDPSRLSEPEHRRLCHVSHRTPEHAERCLDLIQTAINAALMSSDLEGMRVLSQAKNALYEKVQRLRTLLQEVPDVPDLDAAATAPPAAPGHAPAARPTAAPAAPAGGDWEESDTMDEVIRAAVAEVDGKGAPGPPAGPARPASGPGPGSSQEIPSVGAAGAKGAKGAKGVKSALTLAAEAKDRVKRQESKQRAMAAAKQAKEDRLKQRYTAGGNATKKGRWYGPLWIWIIAAVVVVGGSGAWIAMNLLKETGKPKITSNNSPPRMISITLEQTTSGIVARPQSKDHEGDRVSFTIRWFLNDAPVPGRSTARMQPDLYKVGDRVVAEVRPRDQFAVGPAMSSRPLVVRDLSRRPAPAPTPKN